MFGNNNEYKTKYEALAKQMTSADIELSALKRENEEYKTTIEDLDSKVNSLATTHAVEVEQYKSKMKKLENSVNARVNSALASVGVTTFANETIYNQPTQTPDETLKKFMSLTGVDRTDYYNQNQEAITLALGTVKK
jgi:hypothetical protein